MPVGERNTHQSVVIPQIHGNDAGSARARERRKLGLFDRSIARGHKHIAIGIVLLDGQHCVDLLTLAQRQEVDDGLATRAATGQGQFVHIEPIDFAAIGEAQQRVVGIGHKQLFDEVFVLDGRGRLAATAPTLRLIVGHRLRLGIASVRQSDHNVLRLDQILVGQIKLRMDNLGAPRVTELITNL